MTVQDLELPKKGFTKQERAWLEDVLLPAIQTVKAIQGRNVTISDDENGQTINADDCTPCP